MQAVIGKVYGLHSTAFTRCIAEKRRGHTLGFMAVRTNYRQLRRVFEYFAIRSLAFDTSHVRDALEEMGWTGKKWSPALVWFANATSAPSLATFATKAEIDTFTPGGIDALFTQDPESK